MMQLLTAEQAAAAHEAQRLAFKEALGKTLRFFPGINPAALFFFQAETMDCGLVADDDKSSALAEVLREGKP